MFEELSIPCKLVLNVVGIEEIETLAILKSTICVSGFDSSSKFNLLKVVLVLSISKNVLEAFVSNRSWCNRVCSTLKFPPIRKVSVPIKRVSPFGLCSKALVLTTEYIALKWSRQTKVSTSDLGSI
ncbi:hypothetical protein Gotur_035660 [Gossypium turneri]